MFEKTKTFVPNKKYFWCQLRRNDDDDDGFAVFRDTDRSTGADVSSNAAPLGEGSRRPGFEPGPCLHDLVLGPTGTERFFRRPGDPPEPKPELGSHDDDLQRRH